MENKYIRDSNMWITREEYYENTGTVSAPVLVLRNAISFTFDSKGNTITRIDAQGTTIEKTITYSYDALNRLTTTIQPGNITTAYGYNTNSNLTSVTDANNNITTYTYDDKGRIYQTISPDTGTTTYAYDPAGNLTTKTDAKGTAITYTYDAANRLTKIDFPTDTDIHYAYDTCLNGKGRLCTMTDQGGTTSYEYTAKGQVKKETKTIDSIQYVTQYTYDQNGNLKTMTYPSGRVIAYNYTNDRAITVLNNAANLATNIQYKAFGGMSAVTYGNGIAGAISYDNQYRISSITVGTVMNLTYTDDSNGNITGITNVLEPTKNKSFTYDALDRLSTATSAGIWGNLAWTYDGVGNRLTENANTYTYTTNTNKLATANSLSYSYDNNGNTTAEGTRAYTYNQNQRLIQIVDSAISANYTYNGNGQRVKKVVNGTTTVFHYNLNGQIIAESNTSGTITAEYVYLNGAPLTKIDATGTYYYHNDHLATPQKMTDSSGTVVWSADYKPFGEVTITVNTITNNLRFPGQYYDAETGLSYNYFRDYNPVIGRYVQADPIGIRHGKNHLYVYVHDNPVNFIDPSGLYGQAIVACLESPACTGAIITVGGAIANGIGNAIGNAISTSNSSDDDADVPSRSIPLPKRPKCGCTCTCRADADDNVPGNIRPGDITFAFGTATAGNCAEASKEAKRMATHALGKKPKHIGCRCAGK